MPGKAVFSDLDGTLSSGFITVDFLRFLEKKHVLEPSAFALHEKIMQDYTEGKITYLETVQKWSRAVALCMEGIEVEKAERLAREFFQEWKETNLYPSTKPLVKMLQQHGYKFFLVSVGMELHLRLVSDEIGADGFAGMRLGIEKGKFNGALESDIHSEDGKAKAISILIEEFGIDREKTMGFGDSVQDRAIFESVKKPVALNPSKELREKAEKEGWYIANKENVLQVMQQCFEKGKNP